MFYNCTALTTFKGDLSSLVVADNMFSGCSLNQVSLENIANTINDLND
jgi:hypothetical protein